MSEEKKESQRQHLLEKGKELMLRYGIKKTTIDDIVNASGIAKGTFYLYFSSKEEFFRRLLEQINQSFFDMAEKLIRESPRLELKNNLKNFFEKVFNVPELAFYFREHESISELAENMSDDRFTDKETIMIKNLLMIGGIDPDKVKAEIIHNYIHLIFLAKTSALLIENYRQEVVSDLIDRLTDYIFGQKEKI